MIPADLANGHEVRLRSGFEQPIDFGQGNFFHRRLSFTFRAWVVNIASGDTYVRLRLLEKCRAQNPAAKCLKITPRTRRIIPAKIR